MYTYGMKEAFYEDKKISLRYVLFMFVMPSTVCTWIIKLS